MASLRVECPHGDEMTDDRAEMFALLNQRFKEAEAKIVASPTFQFLKARSAHLLMAHGSDEVCDCPEWNPDRVVSRE